MIWLWIQVAGAATVGSVGADYVSIQQAVDAGEADISVLDMSHLENVVVGGNISHAAVVSIHGVDQGGVWSSWRPSLSTEALLTVLSGVEVQVDDLDLYEAVAVSGVPYLEVQGTLSMGTVGSAPTLGTNSATFSGGYVHVASGATLNVTGLDLVGPRLSGVDGVFFDVQGSFDLSSSRVDGAKLATLIKGHSGSVISLVDSQFIKNLGYVDVPVSVDGTLSLSNCEFLDYSTTNLQILSGGSAQIDTTRFFRSSISLETPGIVNEGQLVFTGTCTTNIDEHSLWNPADWVTTCGNEISGYNPGVLLEIGSSTSSIAGLWAHKNRVAIENRSTVGTTITNSVLHSNHNLYRGGAINSTGPLTVENSVFRSNNHNLLDDPTCPIGEECGGGAIFQVNPSDFTQLLNNTFIQNTSASYTGGAIYLNTASSLVSGSLFYDDRAFSAGAISYRGGDHVVENTVFDFMRSTQQNPPSIEHNEGVAAILSRSDSTTINNSVFKNSYSYGGGLSPRWEPGVVHFEAGTVGVVFQTRFCFNWNVIIGVSGSMATPVYSNETTEILNTMVLGTSQYLGGNNAFTDYAEQEHSIIRLSTANTETLVDLNSLGWNGLPLLGSPYLLPDPISGTCEWGSAILTPSPETWYVDASNPNPDGTPGHIGVFGGADAVSYDYDGDGLQEYEDCAPLDADVSASNLYWLDHDDQDEDGWESPVGDTIRYCISPGPSYRLTSDPGVIDNCPNVSNPDQADIDSDDVGDVCDSCFGDNSSGDDDSDTFCDASDNCPTVSNPDQTDSDSDGLGDVCDLCFGDNSSGDFDSDGVCDDTDNCPYNTNPDQSDVDSDGKGDVCDPCFGSSPWDFDFDGYCSDVDNCLFTPNPDQADGDGDGIGDVCDSCWGDNALGNADNDDYCDDTDNCVFDANDDQSDSDGDGVGDVCDLCEGDDSTGDEDYDGFCDDTDNCPTLSNPYQLDEDLDGLGDVCDDCFGDNSSGDSDVDGVCDDLDNCVFVGNNSQADYDGDGLGDVCDSCVGTNALGDEDSDTFCEDWDCDDNNSTIHPNAAEICDGVDNDCDIDIDEGTPDLDLDGICDSIDPDIDGDLVNNGADSEPFVNTVCRDLDNDGCDDCSSTTDDPANDGTDIDGDGTCNLTDVDVQPEILLDSSQVSWTTNGVGSPSVVYDSASGLFVMAFEAQVGSRAHCPSGEWAVGLATSPDGINWTDSGAPAISPNPGSYYSCVAAHPTLVDRAPGTLVLFFKGEQEDNNCGSSTTYTTSTTTSSSSSSSSSTDSGYVTETGYYTTPTGTTTTPGNWVCDQYTGLGQTVIQYNPDDATYSVSTPNLYPVLNLGHNFGYPVAVFEGGEYQVGVSRYPNSYVASGPADALTLGPIVAAPGDTPGTINEAFNAALTCKESGQYRGWFGGRDTEGAAVESEELNLWEGPPLEFAVGPVQEDASYGEWRHWDVVPVGTGTGDHVFFFSDLNGPGGSPQIRWAASDPSKLTVGEFGSKVCY